MHCNFTVIGVGKGLPSVTMIPGGGVIVCMLMEVTEVTTGMGVLVCIDKEANTELLMVTLMNMEEQEEPANRRLEKVAMPCASVTAVSPSSSPNEYSSMFGLK